MKLLIIIFLFITGLNAFGQTGASINDDLVKLIKNSKKEKSYVSNETYDLMKDLFKNLIRQKYNDTITLEGTPGNLETTIQNNEVSYYQSASIHNGQGQLFIWVKKINNEWALFSHPIYDCEGYTSLTYQYRNRFNFIISPSFCVYSKNADSAWQRINLEPADTNYLEIYRTCEVINNKEKICLETITSRKAFPKMNKLAIERDSALNAFNSADNDPSVLDSLRLRLDKEMVNEYLTPHPESLKVTVSNLIFNDLDNDGEEEIYWFSVSNDTLADFKVYHLAPTGLFEADSKKYLGFLKNTPEFTKVSRLSIMDN